MSDPTKTEEAINGYFKLKAAYYKKYNASIKNIRENELTLREIKKGITKRDKVEKLKIKCVGSGCSSKEGTFFETNGTHLLASCKSKDNPCQLNIDINRGVFLYLSEILQSTISDLNISKIGIIKMKLNLLFSLSTEEEIAENFEEMKNKYKQLEIILSNLNSIIIENNLIKINNPLLGDETTLSRSEIVKLEIIKLENLITQFRAIIKDAQIETTISSIPYFTDAIQQYINNMIPLISNIQKYKYNIQTIIEEDDNKFRLIQIKNPLKKQQIELEAPEIISNIK